MCGSVLQCVAVWCSVLQGVAASCRLCLERSLTSSSSFRKSQGKVLCVAVCCSLLQFVAVCCSALQRVADVLQCDAACCNVLQYVALHLVCCSALHVLQCVAVWSSVL